MVTPKVKEENMISRALFMILVIISLFPVISTLQLPPKVMAQAPSEGAKVLVDDVIQALKNNDVNKALIHLNLVKQQFGNPANNSGVLNTIAKNPVTSGSEINNLSTYKNSTYGITSMQYHSDCTINETNIQPNITSGFDIVSFLAPHGKNYPPGQAPALVQISFFS